MKAVLFITLSGVIFLSSCGESMHKYSSRHYKKGEHIRTPEQQN